MEENQTKTRMTILSYIKEYASNIKEFAKALVGSDEEFASDIDSIPEFSEYKNNNVNNQDIQKDIEEIAKIQKAIDKKKAQVKKARKSLEEQLEKPETRQTNKKYRIIDEKDKEEKEKE